MSNPPQLPTPDQFDWGKAIRKPDAPDPIKEIGQGKMLTPEEIDKELGMPPAQAPPKTEAPKPPSLPNVQVDMSKAIKAPPTGRPAPGAAVTPQQAAAGPLTAAPPQQKPQLPGPPPYVSPQERQAQASMQTIEAMKRPSWADPKNIMADPTWYGRSLRYAGGELIGVAKGGAGLMVGGAKMLHDVASALDPIEGYHRPFGDPQLQVGKDIIDVGKGVFDISKGAWDMLKDLGAAITVPGQAQERAGKYADPEKFGKDILNTALTVDGSVEALKAIKPTPEAIQALNQARKGVVNATMRQGAVEKAYVHKQGVAVADEILKAEKNAREHVKEHVTNLTSKIGDKPVEADSTAQRIKDQAVKTVKTEPPGKMMAGKGPRAGIPAAVPAPLDDLVAYTNTVKPGQWTWETVKQFRTMVGQAMSRASGPDLAVLTDIYVNDLTPKLAKTAKQYKLDASWDAYNSLERKIQRSFPSIDKAKAIVEDNGEGSAMANALKDPPVLHELIESLKPYGVNADMLRSYAGKANKIMKESSAFNQSMFRYMYRISPAALVSLPMAVIGREMGGMMGGMIMGVGSGMAANYLMHTIRAMGLSPELLDAVLSQRKWPGKTPIPKGEGFETPPAEAPVPGAPPQGPPGEPPPAPGTPPAPVPGGAAPTPETQAAAQAATPPAPKPKAKAKKTAAPAETKPAYTGVERRDPSTRVSQDIWAKNQINFAKEQLAKATDETEKNVLRRRIEELEKDPTLSGAGEQMGRDIRTARAATPSGLSEKQVEFSIKQDPEKAKAYDLADRKTRDKMLVEEKRRMEAAGAKPVTVVPEGVGGREPGKRPGTTRETPLVRAQKQAERVAAKRAEKGATALGGGGLEVTGGGAGDVAIKAQADEAARMQAASPGKNVKELSIPEKEEWLQENRPEEWKLLQNMRKSVRVGKINRPLTGEEYLAGLDDAVANGMSEESAERQIRAQELIKEQESRPLSSSEEELQKLIEEQKAEMKSGKSKKPKKAGRIE